MACLNSVGRDGRMRRGSAWSGYDHPLALSCARRVLAGNLSLLETELEFPNVSHLARRGLPVHTGCPDPVRRLVWWCCQDDPGQLAQLEPHTRRPPAPVSRCQPGDEDHQRRREGTQEEGSINNGSRGSNLSFGLRTYLAPSTSHL